jgi:hypothetical protein
MSSGPYRAVPINDASFRTPVYFAVEGPAGVVRRFNTQDAAEGCAQLLNEAFEQGVRHGWINPPDAPRKKTNAKPRTRRTIEDHTA